MLAGGGAGLALLYYLYGHIDPGRLASALAGARPGWLAALAAAILVENLMRAWKWGQILHDRRRVPLWRLFGATMAGYSANYVAPLGVSPFVRSWLVARLEGLRFATVFVITLIARFIDGVVFGLFAFVAAAVAAPDARISWLAAALAAAGLANLILFGGLLCLLFYGRGRLEQDTSRVSRVLDALAARFSRRLDRVRLALHEGIIWPRSALRQAGIVLASLGVKLVSVLQLTFAGATVGLALGFHDALMVMVVAGVGAISGRLVRVPGGFTLGAGFALHAVGVPDEPALAMILLNNVFTIGQILFFGLGFLAVTGLDIRAAPRSLPPDELANLR